MRPALDPLVRRVPGALRRPFAVVLWIALPLLLVRLGAKDVWEASEGRPLESAREMRAHGDLLVPYTNGAVDLTKPPLYAWLVAASFAVLGESTAAGRLPSVLAAVGCLFATYLLARRRGGDRAGVLAATLLLVSVRFLWQARLAELETLLALFVLGAYVALDAGTEAVAGRVRAGRFAAFHAMTGLAFATKGPIALLLVLPGGILGAIAARRGRALLSPAFLVTGLLLPLTALPWYVAVVARDPGAWDTFLSFARGENVGHLRGPFHYLATYPLFALPSVLAVVPGLRSAFAASTAPELARRLRLPAVAFVVTLALQSALRAKQTHYLLPTVFPMGCVLGGVWLDARLSRSPRLAAPLGVAFAAVTALLFVGVSVFVPRANAAHSPRRFFEDVGARVPVGAPLGWTVFGSHSDYLWALPEAHVGAHGLPELVEPTEAATIARVRAWLDAAPTAHAIVTGAQADALRDVAEVLVRDDAVGRKERSFALVRRRASGDAR